SRSRRPGRRSRTPGTRGASTPPGPPAHRPASRRTLRCRTYLPPFLDQLFGEGARRRLRDEPDDRLGIRRPHVEPAVTPGEPQSVVRVHTRVGETGPECVID